MSLSVNAKRSQRLADYFSVVGIGDSLQRLGNPLAAHGPSSLGTSTAADGTEHPLETTYRARVLHRFPEGDNEEYPFPSNLALFCLPGGLKLTRAMELPTFFVFVHTRANGEHLYGFVFTFHEALEPAQCEQAETALVHFKEAATARGESIEKLDMATGGRWYAPCCLCLLSSWPYFTGFREWLTNLFRISLSPAQIPLERYVSNFLLEVPCPVPGRVEVLYHMNAGGGGPSVGTPTISFACPPPNKPVSWPSLPLEPLFRCLSHEHVVTVFEALILERSVLLRSASLFLLTACAEAVTALLYPLNWTHVYIPVLPEALVGVLAAPMPFLVGLRSSVVEDASLDVQRHVIQVDLDTDTVEAIEPALPLPLKRRTKLLAVLAEHADVAYARSPEWREVLMGGADLAFPMAVRPCDFTEGMDAERAAAAEPDWDAVREAFLRVFTSLLKPYRRCLVFPTKLDPNPRQLFLKEEFLERCDADNRPFVEALLETQAMSSFIEARVPPDPEDQDVIFFDESIDAKLNRSMLNVVKRDTEFLRSTAKVKTVVALTPDLRGIDPTTLAQSRPGTFPQLLTELYPAPRSMPNALPALQNRSRNLARHGRRRSGPFRIRRTEEDEALLPPAATVHCIFLVLFSATVGRDPAKPVAVTLAQNDTLPSAAGASIARMPSHGRTVTISATGAGTGTPRSSSEATAAQSQHVAFTSVPVQASEGHAKRPSTGGNAVPPPLPPRNGLLRRRSSRAMAVAAAHAESSSSDAGDAAMPGNAAGGSAVAVPVQQAEAAVAAAADEEGHLRRTSSEGVAREEDLDLPGSGRDADWGRRRVSFALAVTSMLYGRRSELLLEALRLEDGQERQESLFRVLAGPPPLPPRPAPPPYSKEDPLKKQQSFSVALGAEKAASVSVQSADPADVAVITQQESLPPPPPLKLAPSVAAAAVDKEEKLEAAKSALLLEFEVVESMRRSHLDIEPAAYRSLINACGRCGSSEQAIQVAEMMLQAGIMPDAEVSRCLVDACAMDESFSRAASPFDLIDWSKFVPKKASNGRSRGLIAQALEDHRPTDISSFSFRRLMRLARGGPGTPTGSTDANSSSAHGSENGNGAAMLSPARPADGRTVPNGAVTTSDMSPAMVRQVHLGGAILSALFPGLQIDMEHETCPQCKRTLSGKEIRAGWQRDSNVYTTLCPGLKDNVPCGRRFVARFSVKCSDPSWEGSTGVGQPLWCEYLSPWVLRKEVQNLLASYGIDFLCSPDFRLSKGGASTNATIFWNLVVHFQQHSLPIAFLLAGSFTSNLMLSA